MAAISQGISPVALDIQNNVFDPNIGNEEHLAKFGYEQELRRSFSLVGLIGFSFSIVTCWTALSGVLIVGITSGGPPVMVWSWLGVTAFSLCVAYSFAEMCSAYPVAGGQYSWVAILAPPKYARSMSYVTGWFMCTGAIAMGATNNFLGANFILGMANLNNPEFVIERWHCVLIAYLFAIAAGITNIFLVKLFDKLSTGFLCWNVVSFFVVIITILTTNKNKQSASFVFSDFQNDTGFTSPGMAVMIGLLQSFFGLVCYDSATHLVEESLEPRRQAPFAIVMSVWLGGFTGFVFLVAAFFCIGDLETTASTPTGVPIIQIFYDSTGSVAGASVLTAMIVVITCGAANGLMAEGSRSLWAFARDNGLPFSGSISKVNKRTMVPVNAIILCTILQMALNTIYFASYEGFSTVISISTFGFYLSYAMPLLARLWSHMTGNAIFMPGPYSMGKWGPLVNAIGLVFLVFACVDFNFPQVGPVTAENMNYCSAAFGIIGLISLATWIFYGRKKFTGPVTEVVHTVGAGDSKPTVGSVGAISRTSSDEIVHDGHDDEKQLRKKEEEIAAMK